MKTTDVSRQAAATLAAVNAALRRAEDLTWTDPDFQEWERKQVNDYPIGGILNDTDGTWRWTRHFPGESSREVGVSVHVRPMAELHPVADAGRPASTRTEDYPPSESTVHGPLLLGPEPPTIDWPCSDCYGTGEVLLLGARELAECGICDGSGRQQAEVAW